jgi:arginase
MERIFLIENNSELGAGTRGASLGIPALRIAALNRGSEIFDDYQRVEIEHHNDLLWRPVRTQFAKRVEGIVRVYERLSRAIGDLVEKDYFPVVLAGDHSSAGGTIAGLAAAYPESRLGVIWIDAHADLHTPYTTPSGNVHGMPLATALGVDNKEEQTNDPSEDEVRAWESLKWVGGLSPKIYPEDLFFLGVRDTETPEDRLMEREHIPILPYRKVGK